MSLDKFDAAIQSARLAHADGNQGKFVEAIDEARLALAGHPRLAVRLTKARDSFPTLEALQIITQVCRDVAKIHPR